MTGEFRKKVLITGASRGIGAACAALFAGNGYSVAANYLASEDEALRLGQITGAALYKADVSDYGAVHAMLRDFGGCGTVICNAGIALQKMFSDTTPDEWRHVFAVNTDGVYNVCHAAIPYMVHEKWGRIIIISSMWGVRGASCETAYSSSKAALIGLSKALAKELGPSGITVNCIAPGVIDTDMNSALPPEIIESLAEDTPTARLGTPEDVAAAALFFASESAGFITGQTLCVDGGFAV